MMKDNFLQKSENWDNPIKVKMVEVFINHIINNKILSPQAKVIEFGCGTGLVGLQLAKLVSHITMIDNSPSMLDVLNKKLSDSEISNISSFLGELDNYRGEPVDSIVGLMVLHHIENIQDTLNKAYSNLKGGSVIIIGDLIKEDGSFHEGEVVPHNGFELDQLTLLVANSKFKQISIKEYDRCIKRGREYPMFFMTAYK